MSKRRKKKLIRRIARNPFQFTIRNMFLWMFLCCIIATGAGYMIRAVRGLETGNHNNWFVFVMFVLVSPILVMIVLSIALSFWKRK
ncbi:MAG: hypothetical protein ACI9G1_004692 [Pirellulaceae bacterium]|jgi:hypothetical protein